MAGEKVVPALHGSQKELGGTGGDQRSFIFQAVLTPSPLHFMSESLLWCLLALLPVFVCLWLLSQYMLSFHLSFSSNWSPLHSFISPHSLSVALSGRLWWSVVLRCLPSQHMAGLSHQSLEPVPEEPGRGSG